MHVVIVGTAEDRRRLTAQLPEGIEVVGEARTVREARRWPSADAILMAATSATVAAGAGDREHEVEPFESLTPREVDVLRLLARGLPNKSIAATLGISDQTVKFHVAAIYGKLGASNRTDASRRALRLGLIPL
jgi:DNA-binding NarL/FixJ family response regulator